MRHAVRKMKQHTDCMKKNTGIDYKSKKETGHGTYYNTDKTYNLSDGRQSSWIPTAFVLRTKNRGGLSYLLTDYDRGFSGNPCDAGEDRALSLDVLPQEFP